MNIEEMRQKKQEYGLTYEMMHELSGVPVGTLQKIFGGQTEAPRRATLEALETMFHQMMQDSRHDFDTISKMEDPYDAYSKMRETAFRYYAENRGPHRDGEYTIEDYLSWPDEFRCELIDGYIYMMGAPTTTHQKIVLKLAVAIDAYIEGKGRPCVAGIAPTDFHLREDDNKTMVQPDVYIVCDRNKDKKARFVGAPDLAIEVLSPSTAEKDMGIKLKKYMEAGVREYWLINYEKGHIIVYDLEHEKPVMIYNIRDKVPVAITGGELIIDFGAIDDYIKGV